MQIAPVGSRCPTCFSPNPSLVTCTKCGRATMCTLCESAKICDMCRKLVREGKLKVEKSDTSTDTVSTVSLEEKNAAMKDAYNVLSKLHGAIPILVPPLRALTKLSGQEFDEVLTTIRGA